MGGWVEEGHNILSKKVTQLGEAFAGKPLCMVSGSCMGGFACQQFIPQNKLVSGLGPVCSKAGKNTEKQT